MTPSKAKTHGLPTARSLYLFCLVLFIIQGCVPALSWVRDENEGASAIYSMPFHVVWDAIPATLKELGLVKVAEDKKRKLFLADSKMSLLSHGEKVSIYLEPVDATKTKVKVISKRKWVNDTGANNWEEPLLEKLKELLGTPPVGH